jgi:hypothetical protein
MSLPKMLAIDSALQLAREYSLGLPRVADPHVLGGDGGMVATALHHVGGQDTLLRLVLVLLQTISIDSRPTRERSM